MRTPVEVEGKLRDLREKRDAGLDALKDMKPEKVTLAVGAEIVSLGAGVALLRWVLGEA